MHLGQDFVSLFSLLAVAVAGGDKPAIPTIWWIAPVGALLALAAAAYFYVWMKKQPEGDATQIKIAGHVRSGALAYLKQQYKVVAIVFAVVFVLLALLAFGLGVQEPVAPFAFRLPSASPTKFATVMGTF